MGFSFRKSVKIGPVRLNVSKSGVGMSVGVPGARIGINSKGKVYGSAGVKGLTYRTQLSPTAKRKKTSENVTEIEEIPLGVEHKHDSIKICLIVSGLIFVFSFVILPFDTDKGLLGIGSGFLLLCFFGICAGIRQGMLNQWRQQIVQDAHLSEEEMVDLLAKYCHWKHLSGDKARQTMTGLLQERADYQGAEK